LQAFRSASPPEVISTSTITLAREQFSTTATSCDHQFAASSRTVHPSLKIRVSSLSASVLFVFITGHRDDTARLNEMGAG
jgi:hypothetical protein